MRFGCNGSRCWLALALVLSAAVTGGLWLEAVHAQDDSQPLRPTLGPPQSADDLIPKGTDKKVDEKEIEAPSKVLDQPKPPDDDSKPTISVRGRIHADAIIVNQSTKNQAIVGDVQDATGFRRARLGAEGTVGEHVYWVGEWDFAGGSISFKDVFVGVDKLPIVKRVAVGHFNEPFNLELATSSNFFPFIERSSVNSLAPGRNWGACIFSYTESERATLALGAFRSGSSNSSGDNFTDENDMAYDVRATALPWYDDSADHYRVLHLGAAFSQRFPFNDTVTISQGPQSNLLNIADNVGSPFVPSITIPASQQQLYNLQAALVVGPFSIQSEWSATRMHETDGRPVFLDGCYVYTSYFLTGEHREYLPKDGIFGITKVLSPFLCLKNGCTAARGPGAWEILARFGYINYNNPNIPLVNGLQAGNRETEFTLGFNWYLNDYTRVMFNYTHVILLNPNFGPSFAGAYAMRFEIFW